MIIDMDDAAFGMDVFGEQMPGDGRRNCLKCGITSSIRSHQRVDEDIVRFPP